MADARVAQLVDWAKERGAAWSDSLEVKDGPVHGRGVFCAGSPIKKGELLLRLPHALAVGPMPPVAALVESGECSRLLAMVLTVVHGLHSVSQPYFEDLAASALPGIPGLWSVAERAHLAGTALNAAAAEDSASVFKRDVLPVMERLGLEVFPPAARTLAAFEAALSWVSSRLFRGLVSYQVGHLLPYLKADGPPSPEDGPYMLPLSDLVNHTSDPSQLTTLLAKVEGGFEMRALRDLKPGDEVLHSYGIHDGAELVRTYGFCDDATPALVWSAYISREELLQAVGRAPRRSTLSLAVAAAELFKQDWVPVVFRLRSASDDGSVRVSLNGEGASKGELALPAHLLSSVQVLTFGEEEFAAWVEAGCIPLGEDYFDDDSISAVIACLTEVADFCLQRYPSGAAALAAGSEGGGAAAAIGGMLRAREQQLFVGMKKAAASLYLRYEEARGEEDEEEGEEEGDAEGDEEEQSEGDSDVEPPSKRQK